MTRGIRVGLAPLLALAAQLAPPGGPADAIAQQDVEPEVVEIVFEGNERIPDSDLEQAILTDATTCRTFLFIFPLPFCPLTDLGFAHRRQFLDEAELPLDRLRVQLYYRQRGFREAVVDTTVQRREGKARIVFEIDERQPTIIGSLAIEGADSLLTRDRQAELLEVAEGDLLNLSALSVGEGRLIEELRSRGYVNATILRDYFIPRGSYEAEVNLRVVPGPRVRIGEVRIQGSGEVGDEIIRALLSFETGDIFRDQEVIESQRRLYNLEAIRYASITSQRRTETDTVIDLNIEVAPAPQRTIGAGFGVETDECVQIQADLTNRNFLGQARVLRVTGRLSNLFARQLQGDFPCTDVSDDEVFQTLNYRAEVAFEQPVFRGGRNSLRTSVYAEEETVPDLFVRTSYGAELSFTHRFSPRMVVTAAFRPELTAFGEDSADIYFCISFGFCDPDDIAVLSEEQLLSPLSLLWVYDRTDDRLSATRGYYVTAEAEYAGKATGSAYRYVRGTVDAAAFWSLSENRVLAGNLRFGAIDPAASQEITAPDETAPVVHPRKRFFAGGAESVRGFGANLLGPTVLVVDVEEDCPDLPLDECIAGLPANDFDERPSGGNAVLEGSLELRTRVNDQWTLVAFVDAGQVWRSITDRQPIIVTPGVGFRFRSPIGPFRIDVGYDPSSAGERPVVALFEGGDIEEQPGTIPYDPYTYDDPAFATEFLRRLQLQFSIGEAF